MNVKYVEFYHLNCFEQPLSINEFHKLIKLTMSLPGVTTTYMLPCHECIFIAADEESAVSERKEQGAPPMLPVQHQGSLSYPRSSVAAGVAPEYTGAR